MAPDRHDLVVVAVHNERRYVKLLEVFGEIRLRKSLDAVDDAFETGLHPLGQNESRKPCETLASGLLAP